MNISRSGIYYILLAVLFVSISCNSVVVRYPIINDVKLIELQICEQEITAKANKAEKAQFCSKSFSSDHEELYLCGEISGIRDVDETLDVLLYKDGVEGWIYYNATDNVFTNGFFCRTLPLHGIENREGSYTIEFLYRRTILDSIEFKIK